MIGYFLFLAALIFIPAAGLVFLMNWKPDYEILRIGINGKIFEAEVADTFLKRAKGLSGRKTLEKDGGMFFIFAKPGKYAFWTAGMNFPLDIVWIRGDKVVDISKNVSPPKGGRLPAVVSPSAPADKVLEIPAGSAEKFDVKIGDEAAIN